MPSHTSLIDKYTQEMRPDSFIIRRQLAQRFEQGMGRAIRSSSDWCVVIITGNKLTSFVSEKTKREFLSNETKTQIEIAEQLADEMKGEEGHKLNIMENLVKQCLDRDSGWKDYYREKMDTVELNSLNKDYLELSKSERKAELQYQDGQYSKAVETIQKIIDNSNDVDAGWYFQLMATYLYPFNPTNSMDKQVKAFSKNNLLHKPPTGITYSKLANASVSREALIIDWIKQQESHNSLIVKLITILENVSFNTPSDSFENGIEKLGMILGFPSQRPDKTSTNGPDNLWNIFGKQYWVISCKNMVKMTRNVIHKKEASQLDTNIAWFNQNYDGCTGIPVLIHPSKTLDSDAFLLTSSYVINKEKLDFLKQNVRNFYNSLQDIPFDNISTNIITKKLAESYLDRLNLTKNYLERIEK